MKNIIFRLMTLVICLSSFTFANASKSTGAVHTFQQPDGTTVSYQLLGDENFNWYQTTDGVLLCQTAAGLYVARVNAEGKLTPTKTLAHNPGMRTAEETSLAKAQDLTLFFRSADSAVSARHKAIEGYPSSYFAPHMGTVRIPIIMMEYPDTTFHFTKASFLDLFNAREKYPYKSRDTSLGYSSAAQFFSDASAGMFTPEFDLYGPYTTDYGHDHYGYNSGNSFSLLTEAVSKADKDIDFSQYDSNNDGNVDIVCILFSGAGANTSGLRNDYWPNCHYGEYIPTSDGKIINIIGGFSELVTYPFKISGKYYRSGIGIFCHEMSHGLGMPDLYNTLVGTNYGTEYNNAGPEEWDLMDGGENIYNGWWPCQYMAWEKDMLGWLNTEELSEPADITVYPLNKKGGKAYRVTNPVNPNEYYIIENYQYDEWNYKLNFMTVSDSTSVGLMITHMNVTPSGLSMTPNNVIGKPNVTILPADGLILAYYNINHSILYKGEMQTITRDIFYADHAGDPYPGATKTTALAAYNNYSRNEAGDDMVKQFPITDITKNPDGSISFKFMGGTTTAINAIRENTETSLQRIYTTDGRCVGTSLKSLPSGLYIVNGRKIVK